MGAGLAIAVLIGSTAGSRTWVAAMVTGVVAAVASFVCQAAELPPPRELMLIMVLLAATAVPAGLAGAAQRAGLAAAGAALAWLVTMFRGRSAGDGAVFLSAGPWTARSPQWRRS